MYFTIGDETESGKYVSEEPDSDSGVIQFSASPEPANCRLNNHNGTSYNPNRQINNTGATQDSFQNRGLGKSSQASNF